MVKDFKQVNKNMHNIFAQLIKNIIFNFFSGIYIKVTKPFNVEDRIEINNYKGDVVNLNALNFELLEVDNADFTGQSTGVITHVPNSVVFTHPLRNYNKAFDFIWNEIKINITLDADIDKTREVIYRIINKKELNISAVNSLFNLKLLEQCV